MKKSISNKGISSPDKRGRHVLRPNKTTIEQVNFVKSHINSFPKIESHYCRKDTNKDYLEGGLNVIKMHKLYEDECIRSGRSPVSQYMYRVIFDKKNNISFHCPSKDQCTFCAQYKNSVATIDENQELVEAYELHIKNKVLSREMKKKDKEMAKADPNMTVACFDLEQVLLTPHSKESILYYTRKLCTFNLTVYDLASKNAQAYVWNESIAKRGACEIATCMYKYLESQQNKKHVILYSDSCGGQNKNRYFLTMLWYAKRKFSFQKIEHKFLERGHTQNENDSVHAAVEFNSRHTSIYTTPQWAATIRTARPARPYDVYELGPQDFLDFKKLGQEVPNFDFDSNGQKIKWLKIKAFTIEAPSNDTVNVRYEDGTTAAMDLSSRRKSSRAKIPPKLPSSNVDPLYQNSSPPAITYQKYKALASLCDSNIIPPVHHSFFKDLRHDSC